jgi:uncharacterized protein YndB with AHSA1/START domain
MKDLGKISKNKDGFQVRFERVFQYDAETLWSALTDPKKLALWFTDMEMDFKEGGQIMIQFRDADKTKSYGKILRIIKPKVFEYMWEEELATWELFPEGKYTRLVLTYSKLPDAYAGHVPAGWHILLDQLETILNGRKESYPFGDGETPESVKMKAIYTELAEKEFPYLKSKS